MSLLFGEDTWVDEINKTISRLAPLNCDKCLPDFLDKMSSMNVISEYKIETDKITYTINGNKKECIL